MSVAPTHVVSTLDPVFVCSPVVRSGSTLLQRLICSSPRALIFGEPLAQDLSTDLMLFHQRAQVYLANQTRFDTLWDAFAAGSRDDWLADLTPPMHEWLQAMLDGVLSPLALCRRHALSLGDAVWGVKYPGWKPFQYQMFRQLVPRSRCVVIYRDIVDCLCSAKSWGAVSDLAGVQGFCQEWTQNLSWLLDQAPARWLHLLRYEELIYDSARTIATLGDFLQLPDMQPAILNSRVSCSRLDAVDRTPQGLSTDEAEIMQRICGPLRERLASLDHGVEVTRMPSR